MYPLSACQATYCGVAEKDTARIIPKMKKALPDWCARAVARMKELGIVQTDLLETFDVTSRGAVGHYLSGRREPSLEQFRRLAAKLKFSSMDELLSGAQVKYGSEHTATEAIAAEQQPAYLAVRHDEDLIRELLAGVLTPLGLSLSEFKVEGRGVRVAADWKAPPEERRRGQSALYGEISPPSPRRATRKTKA